LTFTTAVLSGTAIIAGCSGVQSALEPAGRGAGTIAALFWWMAAIAVVVWILMAALTIYVMTRRESHDRSFWLWIIFGGAGVPTIVLTVLVVFTLGMIPELVAPAPANSLTIDVHGAQWWWRVRYRLPGEDIDAHSTGPPVIATHEPPLEGSLDEPAIGNFVELANEIRLPVNRPVQFFLKSEDVIHSFWIPSLGGKIDMIPGRTTRLSLTPSKIGVYRGVCAEYCGASHAMMSFYVVVMEEEDFDRWLQQQVAIPAAPVESLPRRGQELFLSMGCGACHTVRGTAADGVIGPDLTYVGGRLSLAAGTLTGGNANEPSRDRDAFVEWLEHPHHFKPDVVMPAFGMLPDEELRAIAAYLESLQ
jgi:cytochrome c oxidase subunit 2